MDFVSIEGWQLEQLASQQTPSVESFLEDLEEQLDRGEITIEDAAALIEDFQRR